MTLTWKKYDLKLKHTFRTSRDASDIRTVVIVQLEHESIIGYGEAAPIRRYNEDAETVNAFYKKIDLSKFDSPFLLEEILNFVDTISEGNSAAKCGIDIALHDWIGKKLNVPLYTMFGLSSGKTPATSITISIDRADAIRQRVIETEKYPILKIKLGSEHDEEIIKTIRTITDKKLYVDANEGWKTKDIALERMKWLKDQNVEFVEQPMPVSQLNEMKWLHDQNVLPLIADESVHRLRDINNVTDAFDGINIKLMKSTGLREALRMIHAARASNMKVMMGCMIESSVGISAAAHLSPLLDYADLDGNILISNDPFNGVRNVEGNLKLMTFPGIGVFPIV